MIDHIKINNFQSLQSISLDLAPLTVIVGPSSSGKSAFIRALRALTANRRGTDFITHGEHTASISAHLTSNDPQRTGTLTLTRSTRTSPNSYTIIPDHDSHPLHPKAEFTKLGGDVPAPVSDFLGIPTAQVPLAIASQFDKPYLLDAPGTEVARIFGALTNAHIILNGARESNRQKLSASQTLRTRADDLQAIKDRVPEFKALQQQRASLADAEERIAAARILDSKIERLTHLTEQQFIAEQRIPALKQQLDSAQTLPDITPAETRLRSALHTERAVARLITEWEQAERTIHERRALIASIPDSENIDQAAERLSSARKALDLYLDTLKAVSRAQQAVTERSAALTQAEQAETAAKSALKEAMHGIKDGFADYFTAQSKTLADDKLDLTEAAALAARYVATLDS